MGELINGRTPEEIKHVLEWSAFSCGGVDCDGCTYQDVCSRESDERLASDALALIEHLEAAQPKWISVKDSKKPRHGQECLCICAMENDPKHEWDYQMVLKWYAYGSNGLVDRPHFQHEGCGGMIVTHWMPIPQTPEEDE